MTVSSPMVWIITKKIKLRTPSTTKNGAGFLFGKASRKIGNIVGRIAVKSQLAKIEYGMIWGYVNSGMYNQIMGPTSMPNAPPKTKSPANIKKVAGKLLSTKSGYP